MCMYAYCRISQKKQSISRQVRNIKEAYPEIKDSNIYCEAFTGTQVEGRDKWNKLYNKVKSGDTIIFDSVSRMSRNASIGFTLYKDLFDRGVELIFLKEGYINTKTFKEAAERQIEDINTGDAAADELIKAITQAINHYMMRLAEKQIIVAFQQAEKEVMDLRQRTKEGLQTAVINGKTLGRPQGTVREGKIAKAAKEAIKKYSKDFNGTLGDAEVMTLANVSRKSYYKYKKELREAEG